MYQTENKRTGNVLPLEKQADLQFCFVIFFCGGERVNFYGSLQPHWCMVKFPTVFLSKTILNSKKM